MSESPSWQLQHPGATEAEAAAAAAAPPDAPSYVGIPGVRFVPSDQELILHYLRPKLDRNKPLTDLVQVGDVYAQHPKDLTKRLGKSVEDFWYVFSERNRKYPNGKRPSRSTGDAGRWKAVGKNMPILLDDEIIGHKCALAYELFVRGDDPSSRPTTEKTEWKMCEFVAKETDKPISSEPDNMRLNDWVLCRITRKTMARKEAVALVDEPEEEEEEEEEQQLQSALPPDSSQQAHAQLMPLAYLLHDGTEDGAEGFDHDADLEPSSPPRDADDGGAADVHYVEWAYPPEPWVGDGYDGAFEHDDQWDAGVDQFGAATDPDPVANQFHVSAEATDPDPIELPGDTQSWDDAKTLLFEDDGHDDELVIAEEANDDDIGKDKAAAAKKTSGPEDTDSET